MSEQEKQLIKKIADFIIIKIMNSRTNEVDYGTIAKFMNVSIEIIKTAAIKVCQCLMLSKRVDDCDCVDGEYFDVVLKERVVRG